MIRHGFICLALLLLPVAGRAEEVPTYPSLPEGFSSFGAAVCDGYVYVYGGHIARTHTYSTEAVTGKFRRLKLAEPTRGWEELPAGPPLQGLALVAHAGKLYRIGGMHPRNQPGERADNVSVSSCAVFDPKTGKWSDFVALPAGRSSHDAVVVGNQIVVVGGWQLNGRGKATGWHDTTLILDPSKKVPKWEVIAQPLQRRALNAAALDGKVYVVGGMDSDNVIEKRVDILDTVTRKWSQGPNLPGQGRNGFAPAVCASAGRLYASPADGKVYRLNEEATGWEEVATLEIARLVHRIVPVRKNLLLVLGGAARQGNVARVEAVATASGPTANNSNGAQGPPAQGSAPVTIQRTNVLPDR